MKETIAIVFLFFSLLTCNAQNKIGISFSQNFSTFRFKDSEKNIEDLDYSIKYGYGLSFQRVFGKNFFFEGLLSYNNKGANSTYGLQKLDWSFHYANIGLDGGYKFILGRLCPQAGAGFYFGRLMKADQFIGSDYYDLMAENSINKNDFGATLFAGIEYEYSDNGSIYLRINESIGLLNLENNTEATQKMFNRTFSIQLGLSFTIK
jgi:hypothetical protein